MVMDCSNDPGAEGSPTREAYGLGSECPTHFGLSIGGTDETHDKLKFVGHLSPAAGTEIAAR